MSLQIFTNNRANCLKVQWRQLQKMVALAAHHNKHAPGLLQMLKAVVKVEEMDLPLKRNQDYVIKFVTQFWSDICCNIDISPTYR